MIYNQIKPHPDLVDYIDAFWIAEGEGEELKKVCILPDGCMDLISNLGDDLKTANGTFAMHSGKSYLVGTMTVSQDSFLRSENKLLGVRFKPAAFSSFYNYVPLHEITDKVIDFEQSLSPDVGKLRHHDFSYLNTYFLNRINRPKHRLAPVINDIYIAGGQIIIDKLAKMNATTVKQLERDFKKHVGISPKEFVNIVRFQSVIKLIKQNQLGRSLLDIAYENGYYDHAHLTNSIKRYTGQVPSQL